jgi:sensor histidine kinase YesM
MNTLNNIHALVDIDGERAKDTIVELSKLMRYALYEGARQRVPLGRDVEFLQSYVKLMRLRFTDKVDIVVDIPSELPEREIPPMIFITFVENAFKHGISYRQESFIHVRLDVQPSRLVFVCQNSKVRREAVKPGQQLAREGGVGLTNVQRRLQLLYGDQYRLDIDDQAETYNITLEIPLS